jgi:hypothetical protein
MEQNLSDDRHRGMANLKKNPNPKAWAFAIFALLVISSAVAVQGQNSKGKDDTPQEVHLTIVVTGGDEKKPVDSASVYVKYVTDGKLGRKNKIEMNLKTNLSGVCHVPDVPAGKFVIQVIADGWKPYGENYDLNQPEQTINITLVRPPRWY